MNMLEKVKYVKNGLHHNDIYGMNNVFILQTILVNRCIDLDKIVEVMTKQFPAGCSLLPERQFEIGSNAGWFSSTGKYKYSPITVGFEWEGNMEETDIATLKNKVVGWFTNNEEVSQKESLTGWGAHWENSNILELQTPVFSLLDVRKCLKLFQTFLKHGAANEQSGKYDPLAGSMHTHIGFEGEMPTMTDDVIPFMKKIKEYSYFSKTKNIPHRTTNGGGRARTLEAGEQIKKGSKRDEVTINNKSDKMQTLEVRYNESPTPLWVWFTPLLGGQIGDLSINKTVLYWLNQGMSWDNLKLLIKVLGKLEEYGNTEELHNYILTMDLDYEN